MVFYPGCLFRRFSCEKIDVPELFPAMLQFSSRRHSYANMAQGSGGFPRSKTERFAQRYFATDGQLVVVNFKIHIVLVVDPGLDGIVGDAQADAVPAPVVEFFKGGGLII